MRNVYWTLVFCIEKQIHRNMNSNGQLMLIEEAQAAFFCIFSPDFEVVFDTCDQCEHSACHTLLYDKIIANVLVTAFLQILYVTSYFIMIY